MQTTISFLDAVRQAHGLTSDYQLAKVLMCSHSAISNYRSGKRSLDSDAALRIADLLDLDPAYVLACIDGERTKSDKARTVYARIAGAFATIAIATGLSAAPAPAQASRVAPTAAPVFIMLNGGRRKRRTQKAAPPFDFGALIRPAAAPA